MGEPASPFFRGLGGFSEAIRKHSVARSISSSNPLFSALRLFFAESVYPSDHVGETFGIPSTSLTIPSVLHAGGLRFWEFD